MLTVQSLVEDFVNQLATVVEHQTRERARAAVDGALSGRAPKLTLAGRPRKKPPRQLCPVPGCKNPAAPVFGMVCADHKGVAKAKIKKYRAARRAKKAKTKAG